MNTNMQQRSRPIRSRESTPEHKIIPSQHRLQQILEMEDPFVNVPLSIIAYYQSRGLISVNEEGELYLASPIKKLQDDNN